MLIFGHLIRFLELGLAKNFPALLVRIFIVSLVSDYSSFYFSLFSCYAISATMSFLDVFWRIFKLIMYQIIIQTLFSSVALVIASKRYLYTSCFGKLAEYFMLYFDCYRFAHIQQILHKNQHQVFPISKENRWHFFWYTFI